MSRFTSSRSGNARLLSCLLGALGSHGALFGWCASDPEILNSQRAVAAPISLIEISVGTDAAEVFSTDTLPAEVLPVDESTASLGSVEAATPETPRAPALPAVVTHPASSAPSAETSLPPEDRNFHETTASSGHSGENVPGSLSSGRAASAHGSAAGRAVTRGAGAAARAKHKARLMAWTAACSDLFPHESRVARTELTVTLAVDPEGHARLVHLDQNHPLVGQFAPAAQACTKRLRFAPARDAGGSTMASVAKVKLVFRRES